MHIKKYAHSYTVRCVIDKRGKCVRCCVAAGGGNGAPQRARSTADFRALLRVEKNDLKDIYHISFLMVKGASSSSAHSNGANDDMIIIHTQQTRTLRRTLTHSHAHDTLFFCWALLVVTGGWPSIGKLKLTHKHKHTHTH